MKTFGKVLWNVLAVIGVFSLAGISAPDGVALLAEAAGNLFRALSGAGQAEALGVVVRFTV